MPWVANVAVARTRVRVWEGQSWQNVGKYEKSVFSGNSRFQKKCDFLEISENYEN